MSESPSGVNISKHSVGPVKKFLTFLSFVFMHDSECFWVKSNCFGCDDLRLNNMPGSARNK